jgi:hypothetical protein
MLTGTQISNHFFVYFAVLCGTRAVLHEEQAAPYAFFVGCVLILRYPAGQKTPGR